MNGFEDYTYSEWIEDLVNISQEFASDIFATGFFMVQDTRRGCLACGSKTVLSKKPY